MKENEQKIVESIRDSYLEKTQKQQTLDELLALDAKVRRPAEIFTFSFGTVGALVLGTGMSLAMKTIGATLSFAMPLGIVVGVLGIAMVSANYFIYKAILKSRKKKYAKEIVALSDVLLNN